MRLNRKGAALAAALGIAVVVFAVMANVGLSAPRPYYRAGGVELYLALGRGNETNLVLEVYEEGGRPVNFTALLTGPAPGRVAEVGRARGPGRAAVPIGSYLAEAARLAESHGWRPGEVKVGILAHITRAHVENDTVVLETAIVSIPVGPGEAAGKDVVARIAFRPAMVHRIPINRTALQGLRLGAPALQGPPETIYSSCAAVDWYVSCYYYELADSVAKLGGVPIAVTYLTSSDTPHVKRVGHSHDITLSTSTVTYISFDMSIEVEKGQGDQKKTYAFAPGPGFVIQLGGRDSWNIFRFICDFYSESLGGSYCAWSGSSSSVLVDNLPAGGPALVGTGIYGTMYKADYALVEYICYLQCVKNRVVGYYYAVYLVPSAQTDGTIHFWVEVDRNPNDGQGYLESFFWDAYGEMGRNSLDPRGGYGFAVWGSELVARSQSTRLFAIGLPVGHILARMTGVGRLKALSVGIELGVDRTEFYSSLVTVKVDTWTYRAFYPTYLEYRDYIIQDAGGATFKVPTAFIQPGIS